MAEDTAVEFYALRDEANALLADKHWNAAATDELSCRMADFLRDRFDITGRWTNSRQAKTNSVLTSLFKMLNSLAHIVL